MVGTSVGAFRQRLNSFAENGRFQVTQIGGPQQRVAYIPANQQGTDQFSHAMSAADELSHLMKRSGDLAGFAKIEDLSPGSLDTNPAQGKVALGNLSEEAVDTGFASKPLNEFTSTTLDYTDDSRAGSKVAEGFGLDGVDTLKFGYLERYQGGRASEDPADHSFLSVSVTRSATEDLHFGIRQADESLGLNVSPTGALTILT